MQQSIRLKSVQVSSNDLSGGLASGITSRVMGGRFWDGFRMGVITARLNHAVHSLLQEYKKGKYFNRKPKHSKNQEFYKDAIVMKKWLEKNKGKTLHKLRNERPESSGLPGGPLDRYVFHPRSGNVMDLRHVFVVGYRAGGVEWGNLVEIVQWAGGLFGHPSGGSAFHEQDYYSNRIGANFYYTVTGKFLNRIVGRNVAPYFSEWLNTGRINLTQ